MNPHLTLKYAHESGQAINTAVGPRSPCRGLMSRNDGAGGRARRRSSTAEAVHSGGGCSGLVHPVDPSSSEAWAEALHQAAGCLDDVGQLVWARGLRFRSALESRAVTRVR